MVGSKLLNILKTLEKKEMKRLRKVFESPYFATNARLLALFDHLRKHHPEFAPNKVGKSQLFEALYPGQPFNDGLLRVVLREFTAVVEEFILMERLRSDAFLKKRLLTKEYGLRNMYPLFERETKNLRLKLDQLPHRDADYFRELASLNFDYFFHPMTPKLTLHDEALTELNDCVDKHFALTKYRVGSELKNRERILAKKYDHRFLPLIQDEMEKGFMTGNPTAKIYRALFELYEAGEGHGAFFRLKELFVENIGGLKRWDKSMVATQLINYAARQVNSGNISFNQEIFDIYKMGLENDLLIENDRINGTAFSNIVNVGCAIGKHVWIKKFIQDFQKYLPKKNRADMVAMSIGHWHFSQKEFDQAYDYFANHTFDPLNQTNARMNVVRIFFEKFLIDPSIVQLLSSQIESFEKYLYRNNTLTTVRKEAYLNTMSILKKYTNGIIQNKEEKVLKKNLSNLMKTKKALIGKLWLEKKLAY